jgi:putative intracellular protease/amidase
MNAANQYYRRKAIEYRLNFKEIVMRKRTCLMSSIIIVAILFCSAFAIPASKAVYAEQEAAKKEYVCPPCGCGNDETVSDKPGYCASCAMALIEKGGAAARPAQAPAQAQRQRKRAAILIFDGVQIIDYTGPYEVFGQAGFEVFTVAVTADAITTAMGMKVTPSYTLDDSPEPDVIIIPGGNVTRAQNDAKIIKWIQESEKEADHVLSVCNGAFILAKTGLLDGKTATTFYGLIDGLRALAPNTTVVTDKRYVDNGKIITTAGLSSGIDGSLYVVSKLLGKARAQMAALNMEYNWQPGSSYARASFADLHVRKIFGTGLSVEVPAGAELRVLSTEGNTESWEVNWQAQGAISAADILKIIETRLATNGKWSKQAAAKADAGTKSAWKFTDEKGAIWTGNASIQDVAGEKNKFIVTLKIARTSERAAATEKEF